MTHPRQFAKKLQFKLRNRAGLAERIRLNPRTPAGQTPVMPGGEKTRGHSTYSGNKKGAQFIEWFQSDSTVTAIRRGIRKGNIRFAQEADPKRRTMSCVPFVCPK